MVKKGLKTIVRKVFIDKARKRMYRDLIVRSHDRPLINKQYQYALGNIILNQVEEKNFNPNAERALRNVILKGIFFGTKEARRYANKYGEKPPKLMTIAPSIWCNLQCIGCYANAFKDELLAQGKSEKSWIETGEHVLYFNLFNKIINDAKRNFGMRFFVITGGEPLLYQSQGKTIYDVYAQHKDCYFLMYTNGTLLAKKENAEKLAALGNVTPAFSVEGFREETEERRGKGVYDKIIQGIDNIKKERVPFGISFTITRQNVDILLNPEKRKKFIDFYFKEKGASYLWGFQYMPIGRDVDFSMTVLPKQRLELIMAEQEMIFKDKIFVADFWNSAPASDGCISAGRAGGYFYIDWDGNIYPCVFNRFMSQELNNIKEVYSQNKTLADAINTPYFKAIRKWINDYGYKTAAEEMKNQYAPCIARDHFSCKDCGGLVKILEENNCITSTPEELVAMLGPEYTEKMIEIADEYLGLSNPIWEKHKIETPIQLEKYK